MSVLACEWCARPSQGTVECGACGGPVALLEPWVIECGWCTASNRRDQTAVCGRCGGPLPAIPGAHPGPPPPPTPRWLPPGYDVRVHVWRNVFALIGIIFTCCFFWTVVFPIIGIIFWRMGYKTASDKLHALRHGIPTRGRLIAVTLDTTKHINRRHPWRIDYEIDLPGGIRAGSCEAWDPCHQRRVFGEHLWVVVDPADPARHALWPPLR